jgi:hypothetical protein
MTRVGIEILRVFCTLVDEYLTHERKFQLDPLNGLGGDVTFERTDGLTANGINNISPLFRKAGR